MVFPNIILPEFRQSVYFLEINSVRVPEYSLATIREEPQFEESEA